MGHWQPNYVEYEFLQPKTKYIVEYSMNQSKFKIVYVKRATVDRKAVTAESLTLISILFPV